MQYLSAVSFTMGVAGADGAAPEEVTPVAADWLPVLRGTFGPVAYAVNVRIVRRSAGAKSDGIPTS
jgi:hypothetical protein